MASIGCHRLPDSPAGTLAHYPASLFSCVFSRSGAMVSVRVCVRAFVLPLT